jgi:triosephosphate isomerase
MHGSRAMAAQLVGAIADAAPAVAVAVFPPHVYLAGLIAQFGARGIAFGGQDVSEHDEGAYTGEISAAMIADVGARYCLVGHSERRQYHGETDARVAQKFMRVQAAGLTPILCIGESLAERDAGATETVVARQQRAVVESAGIGAFANAVVAYEPVWAIGTGRTATPEQAQNAHAYIRSKLADEDARIASSLPLLYGGSVKSANAAELFRQPDVDGGLIGGASLKATDFLAICAAAR